MYKYFKRFLDIVLSAAGLLVLSPILLIIAVAIKMDSKGPVLFKQKRVAKGKEHFQILKFRTMYADVPKDVPTHLLADPESKITKIGRFLRKSSLDELPQIWNILVGEMSIIGPRPQLVRDMVFMTEEQRKRHNVRPGLSGWAQVNGRNAIIWEDKINYDLEYLDKISLWMDIKIVFITIIKVLRTESITFEGMVTAEDYGDYLLHTGKITQEEYDKGQLEAKKLLKE